ncbi:MAG TPA: TonB C-terminal domain-containing protein [Fibrobacteria bacterium]|nr:TonB C-terminal domain-containing protein [Fibrobacteria bacterium]
MKRLPTFPALAIVALLSACGSTKVEKEFYSPSRPKYSIAVDKKGRKEGVETWWHPNGNKKYEAVNHGGTREGMFSAWYEDGTLWYQGYEAHGKPESTLTYWRPNGKLKSQALFRDGIQLERRDYDEEGRLIGPAFPPARAAEASRGEEEFVNSGEMDRIRKASLQLWAMRVRQTVESFWVLPRQFQKERPYRAVAKIKVGRDGRILGVTWPEKSPSTPFNSLAQQTFKRIKRLPPFPPQIQDQTLEIQYEFISLGRPVPRKKLEARESAPE